MAFKSNFLTLVFLAIATSGLIAQTVDSQTQDVERALLNYVEGFYEGDTAKLAQSLLPEMHKYGYWKDKESGIYGGSAMSYQQAFDYANRVREKKRFAKPDAPKEIQIFDVQDQTASGKVTAFWGTDYILLGKYDGAWKIVHVLWQGPLKP